MVANIFKAIYSEVDMMPSKQKEINYSEVSRLASLGLSQTQIAASLGVSRSTVQRRLGVNGNPDESFESAYQRGISALAQECAGLLLDAGRQGDLDSLKFLLRTRCGFSEKITMQQDVRLEATQPMLNLILTGLPTQEH